MLAPTIFVRPLPLPVNLPEIVPDELMLDEIILVVVMPPIKLPA